MFRSETQMLNGENKKNKKIRMERKTREFLMDKKDEKLSAVWINEAVNILGGS